MLAEQSASAGLTSKPAHTVDWVSSAEMNSGKRLKDAEGVLLMENRSDRELATDPQALERLLVVRENLGDAERMAALYESDAVLAGDGRKVVGRNAIRDFYSELIAAGRKFALGVQRPALISGDLALTSTVLPDGTVTAEVARRQPDGTWLWVIDQFSIST